MCAFQRVRNVSFLRHLRMYACFSTQRSLSVNNSEAYSEANQVKHLRWSFFVKLFNSWKSLAVFLKKSILAFWQGYECALEIKCSKPEVAALDYYIECCFVCVQSKQWRHQNDVNCCCSSAFIINLEHMQPNIQHDKSIFLFLFWEM